MQTIPFITIKKNRIIDQSGHILPVNTLIDILGTQQTLYILDDDGIEHNKPNFEVYQKLSGVTHLWIDAGPHVLGDIVDFVFAGAEKITIRLGLYRFLDIDGIRKITECELYLFIDDTVDEKVFGAFGVSELDGSVVTEIMYRQKRDFQYQGFLKRLRDKHQIFILSSDARHTLPYGFSEIAGQILPIEHLKGVESSGL